MSAVACGGKVHIWYWKPICSYSIHWLHCVHISTTRANCVSVPGFILLSTLIFVSDWSSCLINAHPWNLCDLAVMMINAEFPWTMAFLTQLIPWHNSHDMFLLELSFCKYSGYSWNLLEAQSLQYINERWNSW